MMVSGCALDCLDPALLLSKIHDPTRSRRRHRRRTGQSLSALQHVIYVLHHDALHVLQLRVQLAEVTARARVHVSWGGGGGGKGGGGKGRGGGGEGEGGGMICRTNQHHDNCQTIYWCLPIIIIVHSFSVAEHMLRFLPNCKPTVFLALNTILNYLAYLSPNFIYHSYF